MDILILPDHVVYAVRAMIAGPRDLDSESVTREFSAMTSHEVFDKWLCWNGIIGYTELIESTLDIIRVAGTD